MPKHQYPGLQSKFQNLLKEAFKANEHFSGIAVPDKVRELGSRFNMTDDEIDFICRGAGNFLTAAKNAGTIMSFGRRRGYQLIDSAHHSSCTPAEDDESIDTIPSLLNRSGMKVPMVVPNGCHGATSILSESFLHFPATLLLADAFQGQVVSLPPKLDGKKWANPDIIMIHDNRLSRPEDSELDETGFSWEEQLALLSKVDNSPQYVLTSVELKLALRTRAEVLNALSETALNGGWANQTILLYLDQSEDFEQVFDDDARDFARRNGVGIYTIGLDSPLDDGRAEIRLKCYLSPVTRSTVEVRSLSANPQLFKRVLELIKTYSEEGPLLGQTDSSDNMTLANILLRAIKNLEIQRDFAGRKDLCERIAAARASNPKERTIIEAIGHYIPTMLGEVNIVPEDFEKELEELPKKHSDWVNKMYRVLTEGSIPKLTDDETADAAGELG